MEEAKGLQSPVVTSVRLLRSARDYWQSVSFDRTLLQTPAVAHYRLPSSDSRFDFRAGRAKRRALLPLPLNEHRVCVIVCIFAGLYYNFGKPVRKWIVLLFFVASRAIFPQDLSVQAYLDQVAKNNPGYRGNRESGTAHLTTSQSASLLFSPQVFTDLRYIHDTRNTLIPAIEGRKNDRKSLSVGVRKQMDFGLQLQLALDVNRYMLYGTDPSIVTMPSKTIVVFTPQYNFSLWQNFWGKLDRANVDLQTAEAKANSYGSSFKAKALLVEAEARYWRLSAMREALRLQAESVSRAERILRLNEEKARRGLIDEADLLVARAAVEGKRLEFKSMQDEEKTAAGVFNAARAVDSETVEEELPLPGPSYFETLDAPKRVDTRGDVKAAEQAFLAAKAGTIVARQKLLPSLNLYGSIFAVGINFAMPLDTATTSSVREGYSRQEFASDLIYQKKRLDEATEWKDLTRRFLDAKERLKIAISLEKIQQKKFESIRKSQKNGLTIAYQVFQYELDFLNSALNRVQLEGLILGLRAQMRLYEGTP